MVKQTSKSKLFTRGGQITFNNLRMLAQVNQKITHWAILLIILLTLVGTWLFTSFDTLQASYYFVATIVLIKLGFFKHVFHFMWHGNPIHINPIWVLKEGYFYRRAHLLLEHLKFSFYGSVAITVIAMVWLTIWLMRRGKQQAEKHYIRGARIAPPKVVAKAIKKYGASDIVISGVPMVKDFEVKHTLIHGTVGTGKGQTFNQLIEQIRKRGDSAIIFDKGCVFTSLYYRDKTDIILNPFDQRCGHWDLWQEAKTEPDFETMAESLIPLDGKEQPYWVNAARSLFSSTAYTMRDDPNRSVTTLLKLLLNVKLSDLARYLKDSHSSMLTHTEIAKTAMTIRSVLTTHAKPLKYLHGFEDKTLFSIRDWIKSVADSKDSHFLLISSNAQQHATLRPPISMWLSMASITLLSLEENYHRRIWFICDELPTLHKLPQLGESIAEVRKFGGCFVLGMQSFSQLQKVYGSSEAAEIFDLLNTRFFFRSPSADMAMRVSKELGYEDIEQSHESYSYGANIIRDGISIGTQRVTRPLISPAEIMELPDLTAYLRVPAPVPVTRIQIPFKNREKISSGFIMREIPTLPISVKEACQPDTNRSTSEDHIVTKESCAHVEKNHTTQDKDKITEIIETTIEDPVKRLQAQEENIVSKNKDQHEIEIE